MLPGQSPCPPGSENAWQREVEGVLGRVTGGEVDPHWKKTVNVVSQKQILSQFSKYSFQNGLALAHKLREAADLIWNQYFDNCGSICFCDTSYFC